MMTSPLPAFNGHHWKIGDLHFAFEDESYIRNFFAFEALKFIDRYRQNVELLEHYLKNSHLTKETHKRLLVAKDADKKQIQFLESLLSFLDYQDIGLEDQITYMQHRPGPSVLTPNFENSFRDWCWGADEVQQSSKSVQSSLTGKESFQNVLFLGTGAGRLCYDFVIKNNVKTSTFVDFNPLLLKICEQVIQGKSLDLYEAPSIPQKIDHYKIVRMLKAPQKIENTISYVVADARSLIFNKASFDLVFTPWLIDAIDSPIQQFCRTMNWHVPIHGHWICTGPLHLDKKNIVDHYLKDELVQIAQDSGFKLLTTNDCYVPYMKSAESGSYRSERIHTFNFQKIKDVEAQPFSLLDLEPSWLKNTDEKISLPIDVLKLVRGHQTNAMVLEKVDGTRSLNELATFFANELKAEKSKVQFLISQIIKNAVFIARQQVK